MYVVAKHRITDPERFFSISEVAAEEAPAGVYGRQFCPSRDRTEAVCLWEAESVVAVERYLDPLIGDAGENSYFQVSLDHAIGIPEPITSKQAIAQQNLAASYDRYFVPMIGAPLADVLIELAALRPGERVVDIACGTGLVTQLAAERVGAGGGVAGVDVNPGMLAVARSAAASVDWYEASAEALPFGDDSFDVALCQLGLHFFADKPAALREMLRVLRPGARLLLNVPGAKPEILAVMEAALARHAGPEAGGFVQTVFSLHDPNEVRNLVTSAGFADVDVSPREMELPLPPPRDFLWQYVQSTPLAALTANLKEEARAAIEAEFVDGCQPLLTDGMLMLRLTTNFATAHKSA